MEDVLDGYEEPYDPRRPTVCFDETSTQLIAEKRAPLPARPGQPERFDYEYERHGTRDLFLFCEPLRGWRQVAVTERRTRQDFARQVRWLVDEAYRRRNGSGSCWTTSTPIAPPRSMQRLPPLRRGGSSGAWSSTTPQSMAVG